MDIERFWRDVLRQDRAALPGWFCPEAVIRWHCTNEQFTVAEFVRVNCDYPGEWDGEVERSESRGGEALSVVRVFPREGSASFHVVSFFTLEGGRIASLDEYWADDAPPPEWRRSMGVGAPIRPIPPRP